MKGEKAHLLAPRLQLLPFSAAVVRVPSLARQGCFCALLAVVLPLLLQGQVLSQVQALLWQGSQGEAVLQLLQAPVLLHTPDWVLLLEDPLLGRVAVLLPASPELLPDWDGTAVLLSESLLFQKPRRWCRQVAVLPQAWAAQLAADV